MHTDNFDSTTESETEIIISDIVSATESETEVIKSKFVHNISYSVTKNISLLKNFLSILIYGQ